MSNFKNVAYLNRCFDVPQSRAAAELQIGLIEEELGELREALADNNTAEIRDGIADVLVTTYGLAHILGIDADLDMASVHESNMSKLCKDSEELSKTIAHYAALGVDVYAGGEEGAMWVKSSTDQTGADGKFYPKDKFLKCVNWKPPVFN